MSSCQVPQEREQSTRKISDTSASESALSPERSNQRVKDLSFELLDKAEAERSLQLFFLEKMMRNSDTEIRLRAAQVAGRTRFSPAVQVLIKAGQGEKSPQVLQEIAFSLGQLGDGRALDLLLKLLQSRYEFDTRLRAITALGRISGVDSDGVDIAQPAVEALVQILKEESLSPLQKEAALAVWRHGEAAWLAIPVLASLLDAQEEGDEDPWPFAYSLMKIDHSDTSEPLREALLHSSGLVRTYSAWGLRQPLDGLSLEGLDQLLLDSASPWTARVEALRTIGVLREEKKCDLDRARDVLLRHLIQEQHPLVKPVVVESLGKGMTEYELPFVIGSLDPMRSEGVRVAAIGSLASAARLGLLSVDRCVEALQEYSQDSSPWFRVACASASTTLGSDGLNALENYLRDPDRRVRSAAVTGLADIEDPAVEVLIRTALRDEDVSVRQAAVELVGKRKPEDWQQLVQETWVRSLDAESWELRVKILDLLADTAAGSLLAQQGIEDPFRTVRTAAARVLKEPVPPRKGRSPAPRITPQQLTGVGPARVFLELEQGTMVIELDLEAAPRHVSAFIDGARKGIYDGRLFHRVVPSFVAQGGGPRRDGWGDEGWHLIDEIHPRTYRRGTVGMPKAGDDTGGSQIFITHLPTPHLDGRYTVFGQVVDGLDLLDQIEVGTQIISVKVDESRFRRRMVY